MFSEIIQQFKYHKLNDKLDDTLSTQDIDHAENIKEKEASNLCLKPNNHGTRLWLRILPPLAIMLLLIASTVLLTLHLRLLHEVYPPAIDCGWTIEEAIAKGCEYDLLAKAWMPAACPSIGKEEYVNLSAGWSYYTKQVDGDVIEDISNMVGEDAKWWTTEREHIAHCAYMFIRMSHALTTRSRADYLIMNHGHAKHCALLMLNRTLSSPTIDNIYTRGGGYFGSC